MLPLFHNTVAEPAPVTVTGAGSTRLMPSYDLRRSLGSLGSLDFRGVSGFCNLAGPDAAGANAHSLWCLADHDAHSLKVWVPTPVCPVVGVADSVAIHRAFFADFTTCHEADLLIDDAKV